MITATTLCQLFLEEMRCDYEPATIGTFDLAFAHFVEAVGKKRIDRIDSLDGQRFKSWCIERDRPYAKTSVNMWIRAIRRVFAWAVHEKELLEANPFAGVRQLKGTRRSVTFYEDEQVWKMIDHALTFRLKAMILAAWTTGFRIGELLNITRDNIRNGRIHVEAKRRTARTWAWEPKTKDIREVPLVEQLGLWIARLEGHYPFLRPERVAHLLDLDRRGLLTDHQRKRPEDNYHRTLMAIQRRAFGRRVGDWHQFRRTYITNLSQLPEQVLMKLSGHSDRRTLTHYTGIRSSMFEQAREIVDRHVKNGHPGGPDARRRWAV